MIARRSLLTGIAATPLAASVSTPLAAAERDRLDTVENAVRVNSDLDPTRSAPWWYAISLYAVMPGRAPVLVVKAEGCENVFTRRRADGGYAMRHSTVSAFADPATGAWLDRFVNPVTGRAVTVKTNIIEGGSTVFAANGRDILRDARGVKASQLSGGSAPDGLLRVGGLAWRRIGPRVMMVKEQTGAGPYQPMMEVGTCWADAAALTRGPDRVDADFTSSFLSPWLPWMEMGDLPGHLLWHSSGRKLRALAELPRPYRERAERIAPGVLARDPFKA